MMSNPLWRWSAIDLAAAIRRKQVSAREATQSVLARITEVNPRINALVEVMAEEALAAADAADQALARGGAVGPLHGVPVTIKVNVDVAGHATTDGIAALKDNIAATDSPLVASLRRAGAVIVGRSNTPAFSLRWFTDNDAHGRTLNPWNPGVTPGGSSGGAAAAVATGMGPIAHGNDYGGSIRYPAWACGVVGLRTTVGRVPSYKASAPSRVISNQQMSVQGPLTRSVADARLALDIMAQSSPLDPQWVPAPIDFPGNDRPVKVALFKQWGGTQVDPTVVAALEQAAKWLTDAGYEVKEVAPPHFDEMSALYRQLVMEDLRRGALPAVKVYGDEAVTKSFGYFIGGVREWSRDQYLDGLVRRFDIARDWSLFFEQYPVLLMPISWEKQFPIDDDLRSQERFEEILLAQSPLLSTALLGLPGLAVPTGVVDGLPVGVQIVAGRFREDLCLAAGELIERAAGFSALDRLAA
ncbi:MAG TPA: amidase family protein [Nevskiales bacterium]|nr:amidase family protein [Nevskiales bacterium]